MSPLAERGYCFTLLRAECARSNGHQAREVAGAGDSAQAHRPDWGRGANGVEGLIRAAKERQREVQKDQAYPSR